MYSRTVSEATRYWGHRGTAGDRSQVAMFKNRALKLLIAILINYIFDATKERELGTLRTACPTDMHQFGSQRSTEVARGAYESPECECPLKLPGS